MSRLLGFVREGVDPSDPPNYWIWQATGFPAAAEWDYERLQIQTLPAPDGNIMIRVLGPATPKYPDGVFLHMHVNPIPRPQVKTSAELDEALQRSWDEALDRLQAIAPRAGMD